MRALIALGRSSDLADLPQAVVIGRSRRPTVMARLREILGVYSRAQAAAHNYETLKGLSDQELARRGLTRGRLPRAAFDKLTGTA